MRRRVAVLGCTGSIGRQTLDVARRMRSRIDVTVLAARANESLLLEQTREFGPAAISLTEGPVTGDVPPGTEVVAGDSALVELVERPDVDLVVVGTAGAAGLLPSLAALRLGKLVALANKEALVMAGEIVRRELSSGGTLVPIDSEHSAIWQCLQGEPHRSVECLTLTASGGALRRLPADALATVTPEEALHHPTWSMGPKITVDSANLMNKGLEAVEARWLFDIPLDRIEVLLHEQSIVHSLVTFDDSSTKAQLGLPDMRLPIQYALSHPDRWPSDFPRLDLASLKALTFDTVDLSRYPALRIALEAGRAGGTFPAVLCGADDVAVDAFLGGRIAFTDIPKVVDAVLARHDSCENPDLDDILASDSWARGVAKSLASRM